MRCQINLTSRFFNSRRLTVADTTPDMCRPGADNAEINDCLQSPTRGAEDCAASAIAAHCRDLDGKEAPRAHSASDKELTPDRLLAQESPTAPHRNPRPTFLDTSL